MASIGLSAPGRRKYIALLLFVTPLKLDLSSIICHASSNVAFATLLMLVLPTEHRVVKDMLYIRLKKYFKLEV